MVHYLKRRKRAVAPVIATLLMVAIAVIGGTLIFVFSQGFFSSSQVSGNPTMESIRILGYDARDADTLLAHDGQFLPAGSGGVQNNSKDADERIAVHVTNHSSQKITIAEIRFAGEVYGINNTAAVLDAYNGNAPPQGEFVILTDSVGSILQNSGVAIQEGDTVTIIVDLAFPLKIGRDVQFQLVTTNGNVFLHTMNIGEQRG